MATPNNSILHFLKQLKFYLHILFKFSTIYLCLNIFLLWLSGNYRKKYFWNFEEYFYGN